MEHLYFVSKKDVMADMERFAKQLPQYARSTKMSDVQLIERHRDERLELGFRFILSETYLFELTMEYIEQGEDWSICPERKWSLYCVMKDRLDYQKFLTLGEGLEEAEGIVQQATR